MNQLTPQYRPCSHAPEGCGDVALAHVSPECLDLILRICFDREDARHLLSTMTHEPALKWMRVGAMYRKIVKLAENREGARGILQDAISRKLQRSSAGFEGKPLCDLASLWSQHRNPIDSMSAAGLLWRVALSPLPCWRRLEVQIIDDLYYRSIRALQTAPVDCGELRQQLAGGASP